MYTKEHLKKEGFFLIKILSLKSILNRGLSNILLNEFPDVKSLNRPILESLNENLNNYWIAGFSAAEGSFSITINENDNRKLPQVFFRARFSIGLHLKDKNLLIRIKRHLNAGNIYNISNLVCSLEIAKLNDLPRSEKL